MDPWCKTAVCKGLSHKYLYYLATYLFLSCSQLYWLCVNVQIKTLVQYVKQYEGINIQKLLDGLLLCDSRLRDGGGLFGHSGNDPLRQFVMFWTGGRGWRWNRGFRSGYKTEPKIGLSQGNISRHTLRVPFWAITSLDNTIFRIRNKHFCEISQSIKRIKKE